MNSKLIYGLNSKYKEILSNKADLVFELDILYEKYVDFVETNKGSINKSLNKEQKSYLYEKFYNLIMEELGEAIENWDYIRYFEKYDKEKENEAIKKIRERIKKGILLINSLSELALVVKGREMLELIEKYSHRPDFPLLCVNYKRYTDIYTKTRSREELKKTIPTEKMESIKKLSKIRIEDLRDELIKRAKEILEKSFYTEILFINSLILNIHRGFRDNVFYYEYFGSQESLNNIKAILDELSEINKLMRVVLSEKEGDRKIGENSRIRVISNIKRIIDENKMEDDYEIIRKLREFLSKKRVQGKESNKRFINIRSF